MRKTTILVAASTLVFGRDKEGEELTLPGGEELTKAKQKQFGLTDKDVDAAVAGGHLLFEQVRASEEGGADAAEIERIRADAAETNFAAASQRADEAVKRGAEETKRANEAEASVAGLNSKLTDAEKDYADLEKHVETLEKQIEEQGKSIEDLTAQLAEATKPADDKAGKKA